MTRLGYLKRFATSWEHALLALVTLGLPFAAGEPLPLIAGATAYVLGWVFLGDSRWYRRRVDAVELARLSRKEEATLAQVKAERSALLARLPTGARTRYGELAEVCRDIESQLAAGDPELASVEKIDGLMWNYLSLLGSEATLEEFVRKESDEEFGGKVRELEERIARLKQEVAAVLPGTRDYETKMQLIGSREEGLDALRRRQEQFERATGNLRLVRAELERIVEQLKLLRADLYASRGVGRLRERVNDTIDELASSGRIRADVPPAIPELPSLKTRRIGYGLQDEG